MAGKRGRHVVDASQHVGQAREHRLGAKRQRFSEKRVKYVSKGKCGFFPFLTEIPPKGVQREDTWDAANGSTDKLQLLKPRKANLGLFS